MVTKPQGTYSARYVNIHLTKQVSGLTEVKSTAAMLKVKQML